VGINTNVIRHTDIPDNVAELYVIANASDSDVPSEESVSRKIVLGGTIHGSSQADLDSRIDTFKGYFAIRKKNLDITYGASGRRYVMLKVSGASIERSNNALYATFQYELTCKPFGTDLTATNIINQLNRTTASYTASPTIAGNVLYQLPVFTITLDAKTGSGDFIQISNNLNNQQIIVMGQGLVAGDVLVIDSVNRLVTVNGNEVDYHGTFIELTLGANSITYSDGYDTRTVDIVGEYYKRYL
jgi:hypothetical protein